MEALPPRLQELDEHLAALPADAEPMQLSELDGYLAGILVCPELIMPDEWLPLVWGSADDEGAASALESVDDAEALIGLVMDHYNALGRELSRGGEAYAPIFEVDPASEEVLWELWVAGFERAMALRPESWTVILDSAPESPAENADENAAMALSGMLALIAIDQGDSGLTEAQAEEIARQAPDLIPHLVLGLNAWRLGHGMEGGTGGIHAAPNGRAGEDAPCPCGSGKAFKRCCGLH